MDWECSEKLHIANAKITLTLLTTPKNKLSQKVKDCSSLVSDFATLITCHFNGVAYHLKKINPHMISLHCSRPKLALKYHSRFHQIWQSVGFVKWPVLFTIPYQHLSKDSKSLQSIKTIQQPYSNTMTTIFTIAEREEMRSRSRSKS